MYILHAKLSLNKPTTKPGILNIDIFSRRLDRKEFLGENSDGSILRQVPPLLRNL